MCIRDSLQHAQPTTLAHHLIAHHDAFARDFERICDAFKRVNRSPLGAAALAGTGFPIKRERTASLLGFDGIIENTMDAVSARDFIVEAISCFANVMLNASRLAEELILWSSAEFKFVRLPDTLTSGSSICRRSGILTSQSSCEQKQARYSAALPPFFAF